MGLIRNTSLDKIFMTPEIFLEIACWRFSRVNKVVVIIPGLVPPISPAGAAPAGSLLVPSSVTHLLDSLLWSSGGSGLNIIPLQVHHLVTSHSVSVRIMDIANKEKQETLCPGFVSWSSRYTLLDSDLYLRLVLWYFVRKKAQYLTPTHLLELYFTQLLKRFRYFIDLKYFSHQNCQL